MMTFTFIRTMIIVIHGMILLTMYLLQRGSTDNQPDAWLIAILFGPPLLAILVAVAPIARRIQFYGFLLAAILMVPAAALGIFGGWGILYLIGIIFLLFTAWQENEGKE